LLYGSVRLAIKSNQFPCIDLFDASNTPADNTHSGLTQR